MWWTMTASITPASASSSSSAARNRPVSSAEFSSRPRPASTGPMQSSTRISAAPQPRMAVAHSARRPGSRMLNEETAPRSGSCGSARVRGSSGRPASRGACGGSSRCRWRRWPGGLGDVVAAEERITIGEAAEQVGDGGGLACLALGGEDDPAASRPEPVDAVGERLVRFGEQVIEAHRGWGGPAGSASSSASASWRARSRCSFPRRPRTGARRRLGWARAGMRPGPDRRPGGRRRPPCPGRWPRGRRARMRPAR